MPRTKEANQQLRETQRAKILDAARVVFARQGMSATMADVAAEAEVSQGLAYRYFDSKDALLRELVEQVTAARVALLKRIPQLPGTPLKRIDWMLTKLLENLRDRSEYSELAVLVLEDDATPNDLRARALKQSQMFQKVLRQLVVQGQKTGEVARGDPDQLVQAVMASLVGLSRLAVRRPENFKRHFPDAEILLRMLHPASEREK